MDTLSLVKTFEASCRPMQWGDAIKLLYEEDKEEGLKQTKKFRKFLKKNLSDHLETNMALLKDSYTLTAKDNFDDFMIAMEWDRNPASKFWLPRRGVLEDKLHIASEIQRFIDSGGKKLTLSMPPGTGKSTLIKFLLAYVAGKYPESMNMYASYSDGMVKVIFDALVMMTTSPEYRFNEIFSVGAPQISSEYHTLSYRGKGDAPTLGLVALGGSVTGRTRANNLFITDDLVKNKEVAMSPERLEKLYEDYKATLTTRQIGDSVKEIMLGTVWSAHDPICREKERFEGQEGYYFIAIPVRDEFGHSNFNYEHPDRYSDEKIAQLEEDLDPVTFSCLYMQEGIEKEGIAFPADSLNYYNGVLPENVERVVFHADVAWGGGDYFAMPIGYVSDGKVYIEDVIFDKGDKSITKPRVIEKILKHRPVTGNFEANNGGHEYADDIDRLLKGQYIMHITAKNSGKTKKEVRIEKVQDFIKKNMYFLDKPHQSKEYKEFMRNVCSFSFTGKNLHDDAPDALAGLAEMVGGNIPTMEIVKRKFF